jgi:hypothetical protein
MDQQEMIAELRRVAEKLQSTGLTQRQFREHSLVSVSTVKGKFGSWNHAVEAAGLNVSPRFSPELHQTKLSDDELLREIIRLTQELGREPPYTEMNAKGRYSVKPYMKRWGSFPKARQVAYATYGFPQVEVCDVSGSATGPPPEPA